MGNCVTLLANTVALADSSSRNGFLKIFLKILKLKVCSRPKFAQDSKSGLRSGTGCSEVCFFLKVNM
jgi:hypothetical protein